MSGGNTGQAPVVLAGAKVVTPSGVLDPGWVAVQEGRIVDLGSGRPVHATTTTHDLGGGWLLPGFVDLHMHGGGGHDVTRSADAMRAAIAFHRSQGTTRTLVSLMTAPVDDLCEQLSWVARLVAGGHALGAHLEGPFLASARCGAQNKAHLLLPDRLVLAKFVEAAQGTVRVVTIAPELPGALELIADVVAGGMVAAVGHTDATYEQAIAAFGAGAQLATHLFNAMGTMRHRAPGPSVAALDSGAAFELINDGVHVHDALTRLVARGAPDRISFITDAISATGVGDGRYTLGDQQVVVQGGEPRLAGTDRLAGSTLTMGDALRRAALDVRLPIELATAAVSANPARVLGVEDRCGSIGAGLDADLVLLDDDLVVQRVMARGRWL
jgi:N-acetylglucosamine-6-phosphate deacetylase